MTTTIHLHLSFGPACGRQLSGHRPQRSQAQDTMKLGDWVHFNVARSGGSASTKACRHCLRAVGLLPPVRGRAPTSEGDEELDLTVEDDDLEEV